MNVSAATPEELRWIEERTGCVLTRNARGIVARDATGIRGMVAYDAWTPASVQAHMAVDAPIVWRSLLEPAFAYPFLEADKSVLIGVIPGDNPKSLAMVKALGFREHSRIRRGWSESPRVDLIIFRMRRAECRWIPPPRRAA